MGCIQIESHWYITYKRKRLRSGMANKYEEEYIKWSSMIFAQISRQLIELRLPMPLKDGAHMEFIAAEEQIAERYAYTRKHPQLIEKILRMTAPLADQPFIKLLIANECFNMTAYEKYFSEHKHEGKHPGVVLGRDLYRMYGGRFGFQLIDPDRHQYYNTLDEYANEYERARGYKPDIRFRDKDDERLQEENPKFPFDRKYYYPLPEYEWIAPR